GIAASCRDRKPVLLEVGPGRTLSTFAAQTLERGELAAIVQSMPEHSHASAAISVFAQAHARLWVAGCELEWPSLPDGARRRLPLPTYAFDRQRHWIEAPPPIREVAAKFQPAPVVSALPALSAPQPISSDGTDEMNAVTPTLSESRAE